MHDSPAAANLPEPTPTTAPSVAPGTEPAGFESLTGRHAEVVELLGSAYPIVLGFADLLADQGVLRGLIGPRELPRLWERHVLNSAAVAPYLPGTGVVVDVGSGAGLPGVVLGALRPDLEMILVEPMERRVTWLREVVAELGLSSVRVERARAEDLHGRVTADVVTARAVAPLERLAGWTLPLLRHGGTLLAIKGRQATSELEQAQGRIRSLGGDEGEVLEARTIDGIEGTHVVRVSRRGDALRQPERPPGRRPTTPRRRRR